MNRNQFIQLLVVLAIIGGAGLILYEHGRRSWAVREARVGDKVLPNFRIDEVAAIRIQGGGTELNVERKDGHWRVKERGGYPADVHQIRDLMIKMEDLKVAQSEMVGASQLGQVDLEEPGKGIGSGVALEFRDGRGKVLEALRVGKKHARPQNGSLAISLKGFFDGRYVLLPSDPKNVLLISDELASVAPEAALWLSRDFFKMEKIQLISRFSTDAESSWELLREGESWPWTLTEARAGELLDTNTAAQIAQVLSFFSFVDVVPNVEPAKTGLDKPTVLSVLTFDHFSYTLKIGARTPEGGYFVAVSVRAEIAESGEGNQDKAKKLREKLAKEQGLAAWVYVVDGSFIEPLMRSCAQMLERKALVGEQNELTRGEPARLSR